jgi:hypothetical protein
MFGRPDEEGATGRRRQAKRLRAALEELGPTYSKLGQVLSPARGLGSSVRSGGIVKERTMNQGPLAPFL